MKKLPEIPFGTAIFIAITVVALVCLAFLMLVSGSVGPFEVAWHLATGFFRFLQTNLGRISSDAGTWGPGLACFLLAIVMIHWLGATLSRRRERTWRISNSVALAMLLPLLFVTSFLVPGAILQVASLKQEKWFESNFPDKGIKVMHARNIAQAAHVWATTEGADRFPPSIAAIISADILGEDNFRPQSSRENPGEPPLYFGAGLTTKSDPSLPLVISDIYSSRTHGNYRAVITVGGEIMEIRPHEVDEWIARAMAAREGAKP